MTEDHEPTPPRAGPDERAPKVTREPAATPPASTSDATTPPVRERDSATPSLPHDRQAPRVALACAAVAGALLLACHVAFLDDPWDVSLGARVASSYYAFSCLAWDEFGLLATRTQSILLFTRGEPPYWHTYHNHPILPFLATYGSWSLFGRDLTALRLPSLALLSLDLVLLLWIGKRLARSLLLPALAVLAFACTPAILQYGNLVDPSVWSIALLIPLTYAWWRFRERGGEGAYAPYFLLGLLGGLIDWFCYPAILAFWLDLLLSRRRFARPWRTWFLVGLPFGLGLIAHFAWVFASQEETGVADRLRYFASVVANEETGATIVSASLYFENMGSWLRRCLGWPMLSLSIAGTGVCLARLASRRPAAFEHVALLLLLGGLLPSAVFFVRAALHEFWIDTALPGFAMTAAVAVHAGMNGAARLAKKGGGRLHVAAPRIVLALFLAAVVYTAMEAWRFRASFQTEDDLVLTGWMAEVTDGDDVILYSGDAESWRFYVDAAVMPLIGSGEALRGALRRIGPSWAGVDQVWLASVGELTPGGDWVRALPLDLRSYVHRREGDLELHMVRLDRDRFEPLWRAEVQAR